MWYWWCMSFFYFNWWWDVSVNMWCIWVRWWAFTFFSDFRISTNFRFCWFILCWKLNLWWVKWNWCLSNGRLSCLFWWGCVCCCASFRWRVRRRNFRSRLSFLSLWFCCWWWCLFLVYFLCVCCCWILFYWVFLVFFLLWFNFETRRRLNTIRTITNRRVTWCNLVLLCLCVLLINYFLMLVWVWWCVVVLLVVLMLFWLLWASSSVSRAFSESRFSRIRRVLLLLGVLLWFFMLEIIVICIYYLVESVCFWFIVLWVVWIVTRFRRIF